MVDATAPSPVTGAGRYPAASRVLHWVTVAALAVQVPMGLAIAYRYQANIFDALTNSLSTSHKLLGFAILWIIVARVVIALRGGWPPYPPTLPAVQQQAAHWVHRLIYVLILLIPLSGWAGVTAYPALPTLFGVQLVGFPFVPENQALAGTFFTVHKYAAYALILLLVGHVGAALMHLVVFRDGIFQRMWPPKG